MDKSKVVEAYIRGLLTLEECAQVLGIDRQQVMDIMESFVECPSLSGMSL